MSASQTSLPKRLLSGAAVAALALALAACSDEKKEAASTTPAETTASTDATTTASTSQAPAAASEAKPATEVAQASTPAAKVELPKSEGSVDMAKLLEPGALPEMALGEANAPVTIVEYMSMTCPHCANFHNDTFDAIKAKYIDSGKVRFIVREFPFDPRAAAAFMLARCAPEGQYFPMVSMLFRPPIL